MPTVTEGRSGNASERTRMPLASRSIRIALAVRLLVATLLLERLLPGQPDLARLVDLENLDGDDLALLDDVGDLADPFIRQLRDVDEPVGPGEDLDEGSEVDDLPYRAAVDLSDLGLRGDSADAVD